MLKRRTDAQIVAHIKKDSKLRQSKIKKLLLFEETLVIFSFFLEKENHSFSTRIFSHSFYQLLLDALEIWKIHLT